MKFYPSNLCVLTVAVLDIHVSIWRRIWIPDVCTFWEANLAIKEALNIPDQYKHHFIASQERKDMVPRYRHFSFDFNVPVHHHNGYKEIIKDYAAWQVLQFVQEPRGSWRYSVIVQWCANPMPDALFPQCFEGEGILPQYTVNARMFNRYLAIIKEEKENVVGLQAKMDNLCAVFKVNLFYGYQWDYYDRQIFNPAGIEFSRRYNFIASPSFALM